MQAARTNPIIILMLLIPVLVTGCTSKSKARANAQQSFRAGQAQATIAAEAKQNGITFTGFVLNPIVPWTEGLTLNQALIEAQYIGRRDPKQIILERRGETISIHPLQLHRGAGEELMEPGDVIELRR